MADPILSDSVELDEEQVELVAKLREARRAAEAWKAEAERLKDALIKELRGAENATAHGVRVVHAYEVNSSRLNQSGLKKRFPDLYAEFTVPYSYTRVDLP